MLFQDTLRLFADFPVVMTTYGIGSAAVGFVVANIIHKKGIIDIMQSAFGLMLIIDQVPIVPFELSFLVEFTVIFGILGAQFEKWHQSGLIDAESFAAILTNLTKNKK